LQPNDQEVQATLTRRLRSLATFLASDKRPDEAQAQVDEALALARGLRDDARIWPPPRCILAEVLNTLGNLQLDQRDPQGMATLNECLQLREACAADFQANVMMRCELAGALHNIARTEVRLNQQDEALPLLLRARDLELGVLKELPDYGTAQDYLRNTLDQLARVYMLLGRRQELVAMLTELDARGQNVRMLPSSARLWLRALDLA